MKCIIQDKSLEMYHHIFKGVLANTRKTNGKQNSTRHNERYHNNDKTNKINSKQ